MDWQLWAWHVGQSSDHRRQPSAPVLGHDGDPCRLGVPVPLYQDAVAEEMQFVLEHAETRFAVVEDQEQVDKLLAVQERCRSWRR